MAETQNNIPPRTDALGEGLPKPKLGELVDISRLSPEEVARYERMLADPTPSTLTPYVGKSFEAILRGEKKGPEPLSAENIKNISMLYRLPEQGAWTSIFEANAKKGEDGKVERANWKQVPGMMDAYDEWLETAGQNLAKVTESKLEVGKQLDAKVESKTELRKQKIDTNLSKTTKEGGLDQGLNQQNEKLRQSVASALGFLDASVSSQITIEAQKTLTQIQSDEKSGKESKDPAIVRDANNQIDTTATLANIQAGIIIGQEKTLTDSITDPAKKESFQKEVEKLRGMNIGGRIDGKEKVISSIQSDPSLPREVATRHEETAKRLLDGATDVKARRYQDGTYIIDSKSKAGEDQTLTLDGQGNVTLTVGGLDYSTRFLDRSVDTSERDNAINNNKTLDKARALTTQKMDVDLGTMADLNLYPDIGVEAKKLVPTLIDQGENFRAFQKLVFPQDRERGEALLQTMRSDTQKNGEAISSTRSTPEVTADTNKKDRLTELDKRNTSMMQELQTMENDIVGKYREVPENADSDLDVGIGKFETDVKNASEKMTKSGYDLLGQEYLDDLIRGLRSRDHGVGIWKDGAIDMQDDYVREKQLKELDAFGRTMYEGAKQSATEKGEVSTITSSRDALQNIRKSMSNDALRNRWNNSEALGKWVDEKMNPPTKSKDPEKEATGESGK